MNINRSFLKRKYSEDELEELTFYYHCLHQIYNSTINNHYSIKRLPKKHARNLYLDIRNKMFQQFIKNFNFSRLSAGTAKSVYSKKNFRFVIKVNDFIFWQRFTNRELNCINTNYLVPIYAEPHFFYFQEKVDRTLKEIEQPIANDLSDKCPEFRDTGYYNCGIINDIPYILDL